MWNRFFLISSNILLIGLLGWVLITNRRPLCIDSRFVERIDILTSQGADTAYSCFQRKSVPFNPYLREILPHIKDRLRDVDAVLKSVGKIQEPIRIRIDHVNPWVFNIVDHTATIGEQLLLSEGHLEKAIFKIWYRERESDIFAYSRLAEEAVSDLMLYLAKSDLNIEDRYKGFKTKLKGAHWPQVLKDIQAYCDSPWKMSEHYAICMDPIERSELLEGQILTYSVRPLISSAVIESYLQLSFGQKDEFLKSFSSFVSSHRQPPLNLLGALPESYPSAILLGREIMREMQEYFSRASETRYNHSYKLLVSHFTENLRKRGLQEAGSEVYFDFIYDSAKPLDSNSLILKQLKKITEKDSDIQIAAIDGAKIWFLPAMYSMDLNLFTKIKSQQRMVESCGSFNFEFVNSFVEKTEKLMVVDNCEKKEIENIKAFIKEGPEGFAGNNKKMSFVQFHLPSLALKISKLPPQQNVVALIQNRDINSPILQELGWQELHWEKQVEAYRPKAQVEAIQWFRF